MELIQIYVSNTTKYMRLYLKDEYLIIKAKSDFDNINVTVNNK